MFQIKSVLIISLLMFTAGCAIKPRVTTDYDTAYDFTSLKSYAWIVAQNDNQPESEAMKSEPVMTLQSKRQANAIETILNRRGFQKAESVESADFLLKTHMVTDKKVDVDRFYHTWGYRPFFYTDDFHPYFYGLPHSSTTVVTERQIGTLVLDIVDPEKKQVIWRGTVASPVEIYKNYTPEERMTFALNQAQALLEKFPPGQLVQ
ncbi:DUF4136 domain-containing protein [Aliikangiella maris]|uniref:DUF4136 domain-containing protein n=2 Tax=Aliikangiella maris TaxID=3162458 RepID=A0ABV3MRR3_9GAMM